VNHACDGRQLLFDEATSWLLGRFVSAIQPVVPLVSVWAHGSLAGGDYQPGRSDLDLIAMRRRVTPVSRRELFDFGLVLYGEEPAALLPPVTDEQLAEFVVQDMESFWLPSLDHPERWDRDIWVDLGLLTLARATVTLRDGKLITKAEALCVLTELGAPAEVIDDIRQRRYGDPGPASRRWIARRAELTLAFLRPAIEQVVSQWPPRP
jgi:hypothetical protein